MNSTSMRLWVGLFVLVVFVAGVAGGVALRPWVASDLQPEFGRRGPRRGGGAGPAAGRLFGRSCARCSKRGGNGCARSTKRCRTSSRPNKRR